jgi:CHAD domain-containing protein
MPEGMKNVADVSAHFKTLHKRCKKYLILFCTNKKPDDLHRLRVTIKRINALFDLFSSTQKSFRRKKNYKPYRTIFKAAGRIREAQLHIHSLKKKDKRIIAPFQEIILMETRALVSNRPANIKAIENIAAKIEKTAKRVTKKEVAHYLQKEKQKLLKNMVAVSAPAQLHPLRKKLKRLLYNYELAEETNAQKEANLLHNLDMLQHDIGLWHDKVVLLKQLEGSPHLSSSTRSIKKSAEKKLMEIEAGLSLLKKQLYKPETKS